MFWVVVWVWIVDLLVRFAVLFVLVVGALLICCWFCAITVWFGGLLGVGVLGGLVACVIWLFCCGCWVGLHVGGWIVVFWR